MHSPATNRRRLRTLVAGVAAAALVAGTALSAAGAPDGRFLGTPSDFGQDAPATPSVKEQLAHYGDRTLKNRWFVQLDGLSGKQLVDAAKGKGVNVKVNKQYNKLWNGVSVSVDDASVAKLSAIAGVKGLFPCGEDREPRPRREAGRRPCAPDDRRRRRQQ